MNIENVEASFFRHLYEQLEIPYGISLFEEINRQDFSEYQEWIVVQPLANPLGNQPKQTFLLHAAVQKSGSAERVRLSRLVDKVLASIDQGTRIDTYDYTTGELIGEMEVSEASLSPVMPHASGGSFRSITVGVVYACN